MFRRTMPAFLVLSLALVAAAATTVVVNGKTVAVPVVKQGGKAFVDIAALMKLLGGTATYDPKTDKLVITAAGQPAPAAAGGSTGSVMLPGDNGELGKVYAMGKQSPLYFSLKSAEFTTGRVVIGEALYAPTAEQKLLVLHFTVQNPQKTDVFVRWDSLTMMVVDAMNVNHEMATGWGDKENKHDVGLSLKPAQTLAAYCAFYVPAKGGVPKLIVQAEEGAPVLRYDLRGKVTPLKAPFADPADQQGLTAREAVPADMGTAYPYQTLDITVEKVEYAAGPLGEKEAGDGQRFFMATILLKNAGPTQSYIRWDSLTPLLTTTDGEECHYEDMLLATANRSYGQHLAAGKEMRLRLLFSIAADATAATLALKEGEGRTYVYTLPRP